jgi:hypothetical protein
VLFRSILGGIRSCVSLARIKEIAGYLRELEQAFFTEENLPKGWEIFFSNLQTKGLMTRVAIGFWGALFAITLISPFLFGRA